VFDQTVQLPLVADLDDAELLKFLVTDLHDLVAVFPDVSDADPGTGAWVQAGSAISRAARMMSSAILRRFWPIVIIAAAALAGLLYLVIANLSGASQVWASLATVVAVVGYGGFGLSSGVSRAFGGVGYEIWSAAKLEAQAWDITWLPPRPQGTTQRVKLESPGRRRAADPEERRHSLASAGAGAGRPKIRPGRGTGARAAPGPLPPSPPRSPRTG
jgi:hypothetical protein